MPARRAGSRSKAQLSAIPVVRPWDCWVLPATSLSASGRNKLLPKRDLQLAIVGKSARVGSFAYDVDTEKMQISAGYAAIHGLPDGITEIARSQWQLGVHPEDLMRWEELRRRAFRERWQEYSGEYRLVGSSGEVRWIEARVFVRTAATAARSAWLASTLMSLPANMSRSTSAR